MAQPTSVNVLLSENGEYIERSADDWSRQVV